MALCLDSHEVNTMPLLPMRNVSDMLGLSPSTLPYYRDKGKLTYQKSGGIYLVDPEVVKKELEVAGFYRRRANRARNKAAM